MRRASIILVMATTLLFFVGFGLYDSFNFCITNSQGLSVTFVRKEVANSFEYEIVVTSEVSIFLGGILHIELPNMTLRNLRISVERSQVQDLLNVNFQDSTLAEVTLPAFSNVKAVISYESNDPVLPKLTLYSFFDHSNRSLQVLLSFSFLTSLFSIGWTMIGFISNIKGSFERLYKTMVFLDISETSIHKRISLVKEVFDKEIAPMPIFLMGSFFGLFRSFFIVYTVIFYSNMRTFIVKWKENIKKKTFLDFLNEFFAFHYPLIQTLGLLILSFYLFTLSKFIFAVYFILTSIFMIAMITNFPYLKVSKAEDNTIVIRFDSKRFLIITFLSSLILSTLSGIVLKIFTF